MSLPEVKYTAKRLYGEYKKLQDIYENVGLTSEAFYKQTIAYIKRLLNRYLILNQFNEDHINDCFVLIYDKVACNYNPAKGCLGNFIYTVVRNYCTKINYRVRTQKPPVSLDFEYIDKEELRDEEYSSEDDSFEEQWDSVQNHCSTLKLDDAYDEIEQYQDALRQYRNSDIQLSTKDVANVNKIDAMRKDLLWRIVKQSTEKY